MRINWIWSGFSGKSCKRCGLRDYRAAVRQRLDVGVIVVWQLLVVGAQEAQRLVVIVSLGVVPRHRLMANIGEVLPCCRAKELQEGHLHHGDGSVFYIHVVQLGARMQGGEETTRQRRNIRGVELGGAEHWDTSKVLTRWECLQGTYQVTYNFATLEFTEPRTWTFLWPVGYSNLHAETKGEISEPDRALISERHVCGDAFKTPFKSCDCYSNAFLTPADFLSG